MKHIDINILFLPPFNMGLEEIGHARRNFYNLLPTREESVKRFERSNGLDAALYKTVALPLPLHSQYSSSRQTN